MKFWHEIPTGLQPILCDQKTIIQVNDVMLLITQQEVSLFVIFRLYFLASYVMTNSKKKRQGMKAISVKIRITHWQKSL